LPQGEAVATGGHGVYWTVTYNDVQGRRFSVDPDLVPLLVDDLTNNDA
jgi:hypothetical protein